MPSATDLLAQHSQRVTVLFEGLPTWFPDAPPKLLEAMQYSLLAGGKRLRPALVLESFVACGGVPGARPTAEKAAIALEMVHTFSLVHDDLPAMDDDDLRRGRPTNHKVFGEALAILAGDALLSAAFELLAAPPAAEPAATLLISELARATGPLGMIGGQVLDMAAEGTTVTADELANIHARKTGALLVCACRMGAIAAGANGTVLQAMTTFARHMGLAFQIVDDILDVTSTPEQMGKATNKDAGKGKNTYPAIHGLEKSKVRAGEELHLALAALTPLGPSAEGLQVLAEFVVNRRS